MSESLTVKDKEKLSVSSGYDEIAGRRLLAECYLAGAGLEIGALNRPMPLPTAARVKYVDRLAVTDLRRQYPELDTEKMVAVDIVDDGETLATVPAASQDFVVSSHVIEHCQDPIQAFGQWLRVLKEGGILFLIIPDMRFTYDHARPPTTLDHLRRDHQDGPAWSKRQHYQEWVEMVALRTEGVEEQVNSLIEQAWSIHFHVWSQAGMFELLNALQGEFGLDFDLQTFLQNGTETIFVIKKGQAVPTDRTLFGPYQKLEKQLELKNRHILHLENLIRQFENGRVMALYA